MERYKWVCYGLDMEGYQVVETEGKNQLDSHNKAVKYFQDNRYDFDTVERFDDSFKKRVNWQEQ